MKTKQGLNVFETKNRRKCIVHFYSLGNLHLKLWYDFMSMIYMLIDGVLLYKSEAIIPFLSLKKLSSSGILLREYI